jgi:uncharacterized protein YxeA
MKTLLKILISILSLTIIVCSFFIDNREDEFSPIWENKKNFNKNNHFTRLTKLFQNIYIAMFIAVFFLIFLPVLQTTSI